MMRIADTLFVVVFLGSAVVQYNDPDPLRWAGIYGLAAITTFIGIKRCPPRLVPATIALVALVWAATLAPRVIGHVSPAEIFRSFQMKTVAMEEAREMGGLLIVAFWMTVLAIRNSDKDTPREDVVLG